VFSKKRIIHVVIHKTHVAHVVASLDKRFTTITSVW